MFSPVYETILGHLPAVNLLGGNPIRVFSFGETEGQDVALPYVVHQEIAGQPENHLSCLPDVDNNTTQIDIYASTRSSARETAIAVRDAMEKVAYVVSGASTSRDPDTRLFRVSFDVSWINPH